MKKTEEDEKLARLLQRYSHQETGNEWFTPRVLNRLPEKPQNLKTSHWVAHLLYALAILVCAGCWLWIYLYSDLSVITVRDVLYFAFMIIVTLILVLNTTKHFLHVN